MSVDVTDASHSPSELDAVRCSADGAQSINVKTVSEDGEERKTKRSKKGPELDSIDVVCASRQTAS